MSERPPLVGFYLYPNAFDPGRAKRANRFHRNHPDSDILLARVPPRPIINSDYKPQVYSIDLINKKTDWDDLNPQDVAIQLRTLEQSGADFITVDCYAGYYEGKPYTEYEKTMSIIADEVQKTHLKFYTNMCLKLPRAILPVYPRNEPFRDFDLSLDTFRFMVEYSSQFWNNSHYLHLDNRPVMSVYGLTAEKTYAMTQKLPEVASKSIATWMQAQAFQFNKPLSPFMIGIVDIPLMTNILAQQGFNVITTMCGLPDFIGNNPVPDEARAKMGENLGEFENYRTLLDKRVKEWYHLSSTIRGNNNQCHFIPSLTLGWDTRPRSGRKLPVHFIGYPDYPIVREPTIEDLKVAFEQMQLYLSSLAHDLAFPFRYDSQPIVHIFAANEVGEGACVYPRVVDGKIDRSKFDAVGQMIASLHRM